MVTTEPLTPRDPWAAEGIHGFYGVPVRFASEVEGSLSIDEPEIVAHPIPDGPHLQSYVRIQKAPILRVVFHGAVRPAVDQYPRFDRVTTMLRSEDSFVSISDPTLVVDPEMTLGWYAGHREWSPDATIVALISEALKISDASTLILVGGSGGGFAALKYAQHFPGCLVYAFSPQTDVSKYRGGSFPRLMKSGFQGMSTEDAKSAYPGRFEVLERYARPIDHFVYYYQNLTDPAHITDHYLPFLNSVRIRNAMGDDYEGKIRTVLVPQEREGHGPPTAMEFEEYYSKALSFYESHARETNSNTAGPALEDISDQLTALQDTLARSMAANGRSYRALSRELGILPWSVETYRRLAASLVPADAPLPPAGSYAMRTAGADDIVRLVNHVSPDHVVECGSGSSTAWIASALERLDKGHVYSLEHEPYYARQTRSLLASLGLEHRATVLDAPLEDRVAADGATTPWYSSEKLNELPDSIDLLLVDGPPSTTGPKVRRSAWECLGDRMSAGAFIAVDDAKRPEEAAILRDWDKDPRLQRYEEGFHEIVVLTVTEEGIIID